MDSISCLQEYLITHKHARKTETASIPLLCCDLDKQATKINKWDSQELQAVKNQIVSFTISLKKQCYIVP